MSYGANTVNLQPCQRFQIIQISESQKHMPGLLFGCFEGIKIGAEIMATDAGSCLDRQYKFCGDALF